LAETKTGTPGGDDAGLEGVVLAAAHGFAAEQARDSEHEGDQTNHAQEKYREAPVVGQ